jgi:hypothetical protein
MVMNLLRTIGYFKVALVGTSEPFAATPAGTLRFFRKRACGLLDAKNFSNGY